MIQILAQALFKTLDENSIFCCLLSRVFQGVAGVGGGGAVGLKGQRWSGGSSEAQVGFFNKK